jgi:hypothetical protein
VGSLDETDELMDEHESVLEPNHGDALDVQRHHQFLLGNQIPEEKVAVALLHLLPLVLLEGPQNNLGLGVHREHLHQSLVEEFGLLVDQLAILLSLVRNLRHLPGYLVGQVEVVAIAEFKVHLALNDKRFEQPKLLAIDILLQASLRDNRVANGLHLFEGVVGD